MFSFQVVDTSQLIKDVHDVFSSRKIACFVAHNQLYDMILSSPTKNILWKIFNEKTGLREDMVEERKLLSGDRCLVSKNMIQIAAILKSADEFFLVEVWIGLFSFQPPNVIVPNAFQTPIIAGAQDGRPFICFPLAGWTHQESLA